MIDWERRRDLTRPARPDKVSYLNILGKRLSG